MEFFFSGKGSFQTLGGWGGGADFYVILKQI